MKRIIELRHRLNACPELSGHEVQTKAILRRFLESHTTLTVEDRGSYLRASHVEGEGLKTLAFRADMDALPAGDGARHGCGHDGHCAILCALALMLEGRQVGANVHLIFQSAEETGDGARQVLADWPGLGGAERIYALHNIPGFPRGTLLARAGCFACASEGFVVDIAGRPAHAAHPADGANPAELLCRLTLAIPGMIAEILSRDEPPRLLMHTVVGLHIGGENFGLSASQGRLCLTLRGHRQSDIDALAERITEYVRAGCAQSGMTCSFDLRDVFPDTTNPPDLVHDALQKWRAAGLPTMTLQEPMRWSEDFGWYLKAHDGMFFGIGLGDPRPGLHTAEYSFDDEIIEPAARAFLALIDA